MAKITVNFPEAFSAEYEEFEQAIREETEREESEISSYMKIFGINREQAEEVIADKNKRMQPAETIMAEMGW